MANIPMQFLRTRRPHPTTILHGMFRPLLGLMILQITFLFSPAVEATEGLESCDITCFWTILQHSHVIVFCHGPFWFIVLGGMSRP